MPTPTPDDPTPSISPVDALIAEYLQAVEAGQVPNRPELLAQHPDHAEALQDFFADLDRMDRVASPLRMIGELDETAAVDASTPTDLPTVRYFGDYELLEEVARGGMGVVYKARQVSLNRLVALKMVLSGSFASPREVARFQAEAEAAANLDHPRIVPVFEVGEHEGQPYFSMKFIEGTSLAHHPRGPARDEVKGLITVARAVHHAHQRGVLHRDLKPSNVLIDPAGERHVTDFGLAKRLADLDRSLTDPGQILGTPRYMAPEQAAGRKDLTVAADVYSLGVILYDRLTGQTPFTGDDVLTLLRQVRESEPPRLSTITPGLGRDLETIISKCLDKQPVRRYASAEDLAEDLDRWLDGRPIAARPVGQAERFGRWCRRNPVVAGLAASVIVTLVLCTVVSTHFALREREAAINAKKSEVVAIAARDDTERSFARSLVRPLNPYCENESDRVPNNQLPLSEPEIEAVWELASQAKDSLSLRFLEEALRDPLTLRQLRSRAEPALIAAIGLDLNRKARTSKLLTERLGSSELSLASQAQIALLLLDIEDNPGPASANASAVVFRALATELPNDLRVACNNHMITLSGFQNPRVASMLLATAIERQTDADYCEYLVSALATLSARLGPTDTARACGQAARALLAAIERKTNRFNRDTLTLALAELSPRLDDATAASIALALADAIERQANAIRRVGGANVDGLRPLASALAEVSARLGPPDAARACGQAARALLVAIERESNAEARYPMASALAEVSRRFDPAEAADIARSLADAIERKSIAGDLGPLVLNQV